MKTKKRDGFGSKFGIIMAMAGSAIGLGNLWRFPYLVGQNGGAAFIIIYLCAVLFISIPAMICEISIGRRAGTNSVGAFKRLAPKGNWSALGYLTIIVTILVLSFYSVVGGWSVSYLFKSLSFGFNAAAEESQTMFTSLVGSTGQSLLYTFIFLALTSIILLAGVKKGIEKFSKVMMPLLFFLIILVAIRSITLPGAEKGLEYLFKPDWSKVTAETILAAMGQAFFSLSLGMGTLLTYGSYISKDESIPKCASITASLDTLFAILAGLAIIPAVFSFGINPTEGPGLVFVALPEIFKSMPLGGIVAILFFIGLFLAALTSSISLLEVVLAYFIEEFNLDRKKASLFLFIGFLITCSLCSLSNGVLSDFKIFGFTLFDFCDYISSNFFMTIGALLFVLFVGWFLGKEQLKDELENGGKATMSKGLFKVLFFLIRYIVPVVIFIIFLSGILG